MTTPIDTTPKSPPDLVLLDGGRSALEQATLLAIFFGTDEEVRATMARLAARGHLMVVDPDSGDPTAPRSRQSEDSSTTNRPAR